LAVAAVGSAAMVVPTALSPVARLLALPVPVDTEPGEAGAADAFPA